jgi:hypothetical protein
METILFRNCTTEWIEETYSLENKKTIDFLSQWLTTSQQISVSDFEQKVIAHYQSVLYDKVNDWNEIELAEHFIGPIISFVNFNTSKFSSFADRTIKAEVGDNILQGNPDLMICSGKRSPHQPYFCFHEYKKSLENQGDPQGQLLAAMLVAQVQNANKIPIYGIYITGRIWYFVVLNKKEYSVTLGHNALKDELLEIFQLLKRLKEIIIDFTK